MVRLSYKNWWLRAGNESRGKRQDTLSNHRMTVNHHHSVDSKKAKAIQSIIIIPAVIWKYQCHEQVNALARAHLGAREHSGYQCSRVEGFFSLEEMEKVASSKKMRAKRE